MPPSFYLRYIAFSLIALFSFPACTQSPTSTDQSDTLIWNTLDELAAEVVKNSGLPGVAIAWARLDEEPHIAVAGVRALGGAPIKPADRFHIGSITKSFTATALAALVEKRKLNWNSRLKDLLPDFEMNEAYADVELSFLVRHLARIPQHLTMDDNEMSRLNDLPGSSTEQRQAYISEVLVLDPLDEGFHYSNAGYSIAGYIGEQTSDKSWEQLIRDEIFIPLDLKTCGYGWPATVDMPNQPHGHYGERENLRVQEIGEYTLGAFLAPAGNIHCSVADLVRYGQAHLAGLLGQNGFLKSSSILELHKIYDEGAPYAAGWGVDSVSGQHRHSGSAGTFLSFLMIDPEHEIVLAFLTNSGPSLGQPAVNLVAEEIIKRYGNE